MTDTISHHLARAILDTIKDRLIALLANDIMPCPLCEEEPHDKYCPYSHAARALADICVFEKQLQPTKALQ